MSKKDVSLLDVVVKKYNRLLDTQIFSSAAELSYYLILTLFPVLIVINALLTLLVGDISEISQIVNIFLPRNTVDLFDEYFTYQQENSGAKYLYLGIVLTLTSMSSTTHVVRMRISQLYGCKKYRKNSNSIVGWVVGKLFSMLISAFVCILIYGFVLLLLLGEELLKRLYEHFFILESYSPVLALIRYLPLGLLMYLFFCLIYKFATGFDLCFRLIKKGAAVCTVLLLLISFLYSIYINTFASYAFVYGSLASFIVTLVWVYLASFIFLFGAFINADIYQKEMTACYGHFKTDITFG